MSRLPGLLLGASILGGCPPQKAGPAPGGEPEVVGEGEGLTADAIAALAFVAAGSAPPPATLRAWSQRGSTGALSWQVEGPFAIDGAEAPLDPGEWRELQVRFSGDYTAPGNHAGVATIQADGESVEVALSAVLGHPDLPAQIDWSEDDWGLRGIAALPSAPFPYQGSAWDDPSVLIALPRHFSDGGPLQIVTHVHGHNAILEQTIADQLLVEQHTLSGRDAVLVIPQGPEAASSGDFGRLAAPGGFADLARDAAAVLYRDGWLTRLDAGPLAVTAHSGGYLAASQILEGGGLEVDAVHLFDALYGQSSVYADYAIEGGLLRSVYTASGGTSGNNVALRSELQAAGLSVGQSFADGALAAGDVTIGATDAGHSDCLWHGRAWARWLAASGLRASPLAPPELLSVEGDGEAGGDAVVSWRGGLSAVIEGSDDGERWEVLAEDALSPALVDTRARIRLLGEPAGAPSDAYPGGGGWLVIDGFDRVFGGSWSATSHDFAARVGAALGGAAGASNEAAVEGLVDLAAFDGVIWLLGDEGAADATFDADERALIDGYLAGGGALVVSGAELGYATDAGWLADALGATYVADNAGTDGVETWRIGAVYDEDYPDVLAGDETIWRYETGGAAAVGTSDRRIVAVGFALETMSDADLAEAIADLLTWMEGG